MYRKLICLLLVCLLLPAASLAAVDNTVLTSVEGAQVWKLNDLDVVVRTVTMPFTCETDSEDWGLTLFIDYVELAEQGVTAMRITASTEGWAMLFADELQLTVGKRTYSFIPSCKVSEYDMTYMEDYYVCLGDEGLALVKALSQGKGTCTVRLIGDQQLTAKATVPAKEVKALYDLYKKAGGLTQDLSGVEARWPVTVTK